jgi:hypothetical protein
MNQVIFTFAVGIGATALLDLWSLIRRRLMGIALPDYALVGRWIGHMKHGRFQHHSIAIADPVRHEIAIGWIVHYLIGLAFASVLTGVWGHDWIQQPRLVPAMLVGTVSVAAPMLIMQPAMGAGIAASRTPNPPAARAQSILSHMVFGFGLYASAWLIRLALNA